MTVEQLIEQLQRYPGDREVRIHSDLWDTAEPRVVAEEQDVSDHPGSDPPVIVVIR